jgi:Fe2+ transport system protein B
VDATRLERNLNLALQVLEITDRAVICLNLMDEAKRHGLTVDDRRLARDLGVPVVPTAARQGRAGPAAANRQRRGHGPDRLQTVSRQNRIASHPRRARRSLVEKIQAAFPGLPNARWVALRLLDGDPRIAEAMPQRRAGRFQIAAGRPRLEIGDWRDFMPPNSPLMITLELTMSHDLTHQAENDDLPTAEALRWQIGGSSTSS